MTIAENFQTRLESLNYEDDGRYVMPEYAHVVEDMQACAVANDVIEHSIGCLDPNEIFLFRDDSKCVLHNPAQYAFRAYIEIIK